MQMLYDQLKRSESEGPEGADDVGERPHGPKTVDETLSRRDAMRLKHEERMRQRRSEHESRASDFESRRKDRRNKRSADEQL